MADSAAQDEEKKSPHEIEGDAFSGQKGKFERHVGRDFTRALARWSSSGLDEFVEHVNSSVVHTLMAYVPEITLTSTEKVRKVCRFLGRVCSSGVLVGSAS